MRCLKKQVPDAEIHFLVKDRFLPVVEHNPYIDKVHVLAHSWELMIEELKEENYDYIIDLHHNIRTMRVKKELGRKSFSFYKLNIQKFLLTTFRVNVLPRVHIVDRYMKTIRSFGVKNDGMGLDYFIGEKEHIKKEDIPASHQAGYIACVIGAAHGTKRWPVHKWKEFCTSMNHPIILLGDHNDEPNGREIATVDPIKVYNACGKFTINESADLVRKSKLVISNDTGLMHIAAAFKKPVISLWGNTIPRFGMTPYYGDAAVSSVIMEVHKLWCRPCSKIGFKKCPLGHFKCMEKINTEEVIRMVKSRL